MSRPSQQLTGKHGKLTIISGPITRMTTHASTPTGKRDTFYRCRCDCGAIKEVRRQDIVRGTTRSCGSKSCREYSIESQIRRVEYSICLLEKSLRVKRQKLSELMKKIEKRSS